MFKLEKSLKTMFKMMKTSVNNVVGPLPARNWCDFTISPVSSESYPPSRHDVVLMDNTALAKLPSKVQVRLFLCVIFCMGHISVRVLVGSTTCTDGLLPEFCLRICDD